MHILAGTIAQPHVAPSHFQSPVSTSHSSRCSHPYHHSLAPYTSAESKEQGRKVYRCIKRSMSYVAQHMMGTDADLRSSGASPCMRGVASMRTPAQ
eukprot:scaffold60618_cov72-Phaeocystis_antarctica.AAC.2